MGTVVWVEPTALGCVEAVWHSLMCSFPECLPLWAAAWAGDCRCELSVKHFHLCQLLGRGSQAEEYGLPFCSLHMEGEYYLHAPSSLSKHARISAGSKLPCLGIEVCQQWLENICMCRPCVMVNVQGIWTSASEESDRTLQVSPLIITACSFLPQVVHQMPAASLRRRMQTRHIK